MNEREKKKLIEEVIKKGVDKEIADHDLESISDEEMIRLGQELPPKDILEKIQEKI